MSRKDASRMLKSPWKFDPEGLGPKRQGGSGHVAFVSTWPECRAMRGPYVRMRDPKLGFLRRKCATVACLGAFTRQAQGARAASKHQGSRSDASRPAR
jgi:hypothetical protein